MTQTEIFNRLKEFSEFKNAPDDHIHWMIEQCEINILNDGDPLFKATDDTNHMHVILDGRLDIFIERQNQRQNLGTLESGTITGVLPYSRMVKATGNGYSIGKTTILSMHRSKFPELIANSHEIVQELVGVMTSRVRNFTKLQQQNEKLMSLGKLSAGLAHELNNPAAAVVRTSSELSKIIRSTPEKFKNVINLNMTSDQVDKVSDIVFEKLDSSESSALSVIERSNHEDEIADYLEDNGIEDGYDMAPTLVDASLYQSDIQKIAEALEFKNLESVLTWATNTLQTERLVKDIQDASSRISDLVQSIKSYTHMDRGSDKETTNIHDGIQSTLTMLNHKIKRNNIQIIHDFDASLPEVCVFISQLNQVWTNIIDNALDAMPEGGTLTVKSELDREFVKIHLTDSGTGIPSDVIDQIFDPFFTTKGIGEGTGLGLDIANRIIEQHHGKISVDSSSKGTHFEVCLPISDQK